MATKNKINKPVKPTVFLSHSSSNRREVLGLWHLQRGDIGIANHKNPAAAVLGADIFVVQAVRVEAESCHALLRLEQLAVRCVGEANFLVKYLRRRSTDHQSNEHLTRAKCQCECKQAMPENTQDGSQFTCPCKLTQALMVSALHAGEKPGFNGDRLL